VKTVYAWHEMRARLRICKRILLTQAEEESYLRDYH
jgi:hypothetical protein